MTQPKMTEMSRGKLLYRLRVNRGLTQAQLAKLVGISEGTVHTLEKDTRKKGMHPANAIKMLAALNDEYPLVAAEKKMFAYLFGMSQSDVLDALRISRVANTHGPNQAVTVSIDESIADLIGLLGAPDAGKCVGMLRDIVMTVMEDRTRFSDSSKEHQNRRVIVREHGRRRGMSFEEIRYYTETGEPMPALPDGEGVVDDPNLALADELFAFAEATRLGDPPPEVSPHAQELIDILRTATKAKRRSNSA